jgi:hypothetical protein
MYVLEVVRYITETNDLLSIYGKHKHIGYMNKKFKTKRDACTYYDECNPCMRRINALGTYVSDWDPNTKLLYIVREDYNINATVPPFWCEKNNYTIR